MVAGLRRIRPRRTAVFSALFRVAWIRRIVVGPEPEGVVTLFAVLFAFIGVMIFSLGIIGEYVGRIYNEVRKRPRFVVRNVYAGGAKETACAS